MISKESLQKVISAAGSDCCMRFGGAYDGGYCLQQNPVELADAIHCLVMRERTSFRNMLEIGSASGGTSRLLCDIVEVGNLFIVDDNGHPKHHIRAENLRLTRCSGRITEWIGDSHSQECAAFLHRQEPFDLIFIDADHSYEGVRADLRLALSCAADQAILMFHDTAAFEGCDRLRLDILNGRYPQLKIIRHSVAVFHGQRCGVTVVLFRRMRVRERIAGYWHIATMNHWKAVVSQQLKLLEYSGLLDACEFVGVGVVGDHATAMSMLPADKFHLCYASTALNDFEFPTLGELQQWCYECDAKVFYFHTKGVSNPDNNGIDNGVAYWKRYLEHFAIERWMDCAWALEEWNCCGVALRPDPAPHFSGNFWWARSRYIRNLLPVNVLRLDDRVEAETWIGRPISGPMNAFSFHQPAGLDNLYVNSVMPEEYEAIPLACYFAQDRSQNNFPVSVRMIS